MIMLYDNSKKGKDKYVEDLKFWCTAAGELHKQGENITKEELPEELARIYRDWWEEDKDGNYTYLVELFGVYGIALMQEYYKTRGGEAAPNNYDRALMVAEIMDSFYHFIAGRSDGGVQILLAKEVGYIPPEYRAVDELVVFVPASCSKNLFDRLSATFSLIAHDKGGKEWLDYTEILKKITTNIEKT